ncbi:MAG TPA: hypothetical protein VM389_01975 [Phycisphaerae bacterium]|nr:hypothetical protein [Phycisphaerae bacterium]HUU21280.1 hypothetical protein [Phycisphaerae bacterium]
MPYAPSSIDNRQSPIRNRSAAGGWLVAELLVGMSLIALIIGALAAVSFQARQLEELHVLKQQCLAAGQGQLDSISATGRALSDADVQRLWPGVETAIARADGAGDWAGLTRVSVTATARRNQRTVRVELARYVPGKEGR